MIFKKYDPLKNKMFQILDETGKIVNKEYEPDIPDEELLNMYKTMSLGRVADIKSLQYQRQGRMLTYAPNMGQEATQVGAVANLEKQDWLVLAFRELNAMLYRGVPLEQMFMYWYGNEEGSRFAEGTNVTPVSIPIGSQVNHGAGLAYASKIQKKDEVVVAFLGDGGTSHGEFHEGVNFAAVYDLPMLIVIQNNQYAISTPREKQTRAKNLASKAVGYGINGIMVDGNDILAMYVASQEATKNARSGKGPTLIEAVTYRLGPHTTADDPTIYRSDDEVDVWKKRDPLIRFRKYLEDKGLWDDKKEEALQKEYVDYVTKEFKKVEESGLMELDEVFKYTYENLHPDLEEQLNDYKAYIAKEGE